MPEPSQRPSPLEELLDLLDLETIEQDIFRGYHPKSRTKRLFGGQIIAQALIAACRTVAEDRLPHSLHAYFLRPGDPTIPALFAVEHIREGRSFATRRILVAQNGKPIFAMDASFHLPESGFEHQAEMHAFSPPDESKLVDGLKQRPFLSWREDHKRLLARKPQAPAQHIWIKSNGSVPSDIRLNMALLAYHSDEALLGTSRLPHRGKYDSAKTQIASLDHSIWFHRPVNLNDWLLYSLDSPAASGARGYTRGLIYTSEGQLVASCMQEGLIRT
ncbi:MAG: acyl-CoA thioesterase II [Gammaproteobacteria bacterium]|nr:acyl-CoA thioesterase II [Gammaproteobacteria bacterium]